MELSERGAISLVEAVDRVTRAVHIGARLSAASGRPLDSADRAYLGGFVGALVEALELDIGFATLVLYAYLLQEGLEADAVRLSQMLVKLPLAGELRDAFVRGREEANDYLQWVAREQAS